MAATSGGLFEESSGDYVKIQGREKKDFLTLNVSGEFNLENFSKVSVIKRSAVKNST